MKRNISKVISVILAAVLVLSVVPAVFFSVFAVDKEELTFGVISDIHYYPRSLMGADIDKFIEASKLNSTTSYLTEALLDAALAEYKEQAKTKDIKYIVIPGDLSKNGEYEALKSLSEKLKAFEAETGIQVIVINGNHDIRNTNAAQFAGGEFVSTRYTEPEEFYELYKDLGYDLADSRYTPPAGETAGQLSYAATLEGGYRLIALDGGCYSSDITSDGENNAETRGAYSDSLMKWALDEIAKAEAQGLTVIGLTHFNLVEHYDHEDCTMTAFPIDNWQEVCEKFADAGMHYAFTGHLHLHDIASWTSDNGETLTDCASASLINFPNYLRTVTFNNTASDGSIKVDYQTYDVDNTKQISAYGVTYPKPFKNTAFALNYGGSDINDFAVRYLDYFLTNDIIPQVSKAGGLYNYLNNLLDFDSVINSLLANTDLGELDGVTKTSIKAVLKTVCFQIQKKYIDDKQHTLDVVGAAVRKLTSIEVSTQSCTKFIDTLGFGDVSRNGNVGDLVSSCLAYMYLGDEDRSDDAFLNDALARFERGENADKIFNTLVDILLHDLIEDEILPTVQLDAFSFLRNATEQQRNDIVSVIISGIFDKTQSITDVIPKLSASDVVSAVFALGITDYSSLEDILNSYLSEYMTDSQMETIAYEFYNYIYDFTTDKAPSDKNTAVTYNGKVSITPTVEDLRLPSGIAVTFGSDASSTRNICWNTKVGVTGTDIEIVPYSANPKFTGKSSSKGIKTNTVREARQYPGIDLGVIGIINYNFEVNRHYVEITGLKPDTKYCYRVGDASRGWWSDVGVIDTADNSDSFTFFHMTDSQGGIERQYKVWADTVKTAYNMYPDAAFIMHTGDTVDSGTNFKQWNWVLNTASSNLMNSVMMPTTGNHEKKGNAVTSNFMLSGIPEQNTETGVYYSFDYNNAHFMVLNTNDLNDDGTLSAKQLEWLTNDAGNSDKQWKIVAIHKAIYSNGSHYDDKDVVGLRAQLATLMPELNIDLVLQGHDHVYLRTSSMNANAVENVTQASISNDGIDYFAKVRPNGTVYVINGCSGVKYYQTKDAADTDKLFPRAEVIYDAVSPVFSAIQIKGDNLYFDAFSVNNGMAEKIDSFAITKSDDKTLALGGDSSQPDDNKLGSVISDANIPKTAGIVLEASAIVIPVAAAAVIIACVIKKKREEA